MRFGFSVVAVVGLGLVGLAWGQQAGVGGAGSPPAANYRIMGVTVYQSGALVAREVATPEGKGTFELNVMSLPATTAETSLYAEGSAETRILSTRFRARPLEQTAMADMQKLEQQQRTVREKLDLLSKQIETGRANLQFLTKLESFTQATMNQITEKGMLNTEAVTKLAQFIMETRATKQTEMVATEQQVRGGEEQMQYLQREAQKLQSSSDKTSREAVIVVDKANAATGKVTLYYLVSAASWRPQYKVRAVPDGKQVDIECLAAIRQQTGEDWNGVDLVLSTAMPSFNAAPPELAVLEVQPTAMRGFAPGGGPEAQQAAQWQLQIDGKVGLSRSGANTNQEVQFRNNAMQFAAKGQKVEADKEYNLAAAVAQADELIQEEAQLKQARKESAVAREGQSVTFHLERRLSIPWRTDEQLVEVSRLNLEAAYFYKAVPVLTQNVFRLANLTNTSKTVLLPGEATMYVGTDFVGRASLPLVAVGQSFTAGFGVDPQIQVQRMLVDKSKAIQGGNQVQKFDYRISLSNYKAEDVKLQLWDRIPYAEGDAITVTVVNSAPAVSTDETYVRDQQKKGLLRWDVTLPANTSGTKATNVTYQYKLEYAKDATIGNIFNR